MKRVGDLSREELAAYICTNLEGCGIQVTLTGGSCVSIYSCERYVSMDLDFIENMAVRRKKLADCLAIIGFVEDSRYFTHPDTELFVEFPQGPLAVGSEPIKDISTLTYETGTLRIISPTECVKDRLAAFYFWNDRECLHQALLVAQQNDIDMGEIERWSNVENMGEKFDEFLVAFSECNRGTSC